MSIKELLTRILNRFGAETFTGTRASSLSAGECNGTYDKATGRVRLSFWARSSTGSATSVNLFNIPAAYRPPGTRRGSCIVNVGSAPYAYEVYIYTDGNIRQGFSNNVTDIFGIIEYTLGGG